MSNLSICLQGPALVVLTACGQCIAAEAMLFRASNSLSPAAEAAVLSDQERRSVAMRREDRFTKSVSIVAFDASVLDSPEISLETPDGTVYRFSGVAKEASALGTPGYFNWNGIPLGAKQATPSPEDVALGRRIFTYFPTALDLFFDQSRRYVHGTLRTEMKSFSLQSFGGKYLMVVERGLNPSSLPIDVEPPGPPRPPPPRSGRDWPPGLLTERLRASIATSRIGASLDPKYCDQVESCGAVTRISCHPEVDGTEMFFDNTSGSLIMACGGSCMRGPGLPGSKLCTACPPPEWQSCRDKAIAPR